jgi:hypothetical protein
MGAGDVVMAYVVVLVIVGEGDDDDDVVCKIGVTSVAMGTASA